MGEESALKKSFRNGLDKHPSEIIYMLLSLQGHGLHDFSPWLLWTPKPLLQHFVTGVPPHPFSDRFGDREVILSLALSPFLKISEGLTW